MTGKRAALVQFGPDDGELQRRMRAVRPTVVYGDRSFPRAEDYHEAVAEAVLSDHVYARAAAAAQRDWHSRGQTGCQFARLAALGADRLRWDYVVADHSYSDELGSLFSERAGAEGTEIVSILLPGITEAAQVVRFVDELVGSSAFWIEHDQPVNGYRVCHLRYPVPGEEQDVQAWVMGFGPFTWMPNTRRGPYFELAVRVRRKPARLFHRLNQDRDLAHLADIPLSMKGLYWEHRWKSTVSRTRRILGKEPDQLSAAKCTLAVPVDDLPGEVAL